MPVRLFTTEESFSAYDGWIRHHPQGNLWQSLEWKRYREALGKKVQIYVAEENGSIAGSALVMIDRTSGGFSTWEIPRGPVGERRGELLQAIRDDAKEDRCLALYLSPQMPLGAEEIPLTPSGRMVYAQATRMIDLTLPEEEILARMKPKGRYNMRVAQKHNMKVDQSEDIDTFYELIQQTGERDTFGTLPKTHYETFLRSVDGSFLLLARAPGKQEPIAGLLGVLWNSGGIYYYGASNYAHRASMAPYLLQWETMKFCKARGCRTYDLLGIAPAGAPEDHPWAGISSFKEKFGGQVVPYPPEQQIILRPIAHYLLHLKRRLLR